MFKENDWVIAIIQGKRTVGRYKYPEIGGKHVVEVGSTFESVSQVFKLAR